MFGLDFLQFLFGFEFLQNFGDKIQLCYIPVRFMLLIHSNGMQPYLDTEGAPYTVTGQR
jgi:hypothetical protein